MLSNSSAPPCEHPKRSELFSLRGDGHMETPGAPLQNTGRNCSHKPISLPKCSLLIHLALPPSLAHFHTISRGPQALYPCACLEGLVISLPYHEPSPSLPSSPSVLSDVTSINERRARVHFPNSSSGKEWRPSSCCPFIIGGSKA